MRPRLPIDEFLPGLCRQLQERSAAVVVAPPGSGKTTRVAPAILESGMVPAGQQVWLLQPRRVAARASAERIAAESGSVVGGEIGYQVRFEKRTGPETRLVVATEGVLLRRIETDPYLSGLHAVLLDEFHERSLHSDLLLAMLRRVQEAGRKDLKLVVMSATLEAGPVCRFLGDVPLIAAPGQSHEVEVRHSPPRVGESVVDQVASEVLRWSAAGSGEILVFLPGLGEIHGVRKRLEGESRLRDWRILPLHGSLPLEQQSEVLRRTGSPRIVLATNVAETSLTIDGIRVVIDSGLVRVLRFDPSVGLDRLELEPVCQASAVQRAGRAGRTAGGVCIRLWDRVAQKARPEWLDPEIRRVDVSSGVLQLLAWGEDPREFPWFERPREESIDAALGLLGRLQALDPKGGLSGIGRTMARLPVAPRLARLLIAGHQMGHLETAAVVAAMLSERDPFVRPQGRSGSDRGSSPVVTAAGRWNCDVWQRLSALREWWTGGRSRSQFGEIHRGAADTVFQVAKDLVEKTTAELGGSASAPSCGEEEFVPRGLLTAMPDRLARRREGGGGKSLMTGGRGVRAGPRSGVQDAALFLCVEVSAGQTDAVIHQATEIRREWLDPDLIEIRNDLYFSPSAKQVQQRRRECWDDLVLSETPVAIEDAAQCAAVLFEAARTALEEVQPERGEAIGSFAARVALLRSVAPELQLPGLDREVQLSVLRELCEGRRSFDQLRAAPWMDWILARYSADQQRAIDVGAPERIQVPSGSLIRLEYAIGKPPVLAVRIQEVFSWKATPRIGMGRVPVLLHLLAPNRRPQQVTDDLSSFWENTYPKVRGELRRRYPRHAWPEDPLTAEPVKKG